MTPIRCFRVKDLEIWTEDYIGNRVHVATCPNQEQFDWLISSLVACKQRNYYNWDDPDSKIN